MTFAEGARKGANDWGLYALTLGFTFGTMTLASSLIQTSTEDLSDSTGFFTKSLLPFAAALAVLLFCVKFIHKRPVLSVFSARNSFSFKRYFVAFSIWFGLLSIFLFIGIGLGSDVRWQLDFNDFFWLLLASVTLIPIQTALEDVLFRGYIFQGLFSLTRSGILSVLLVAVIFGLMHAGNPEIEVLGKGILAFYVISGLFMGLLSHLDDGLELSMGYHFANNLFGAIILTNDWQVFQTKALWVDQSPPTFGWQNWLILIVVQPLLLFVFYWIFRWTNVKGKLLG